MFFLSGNNPSGKDQKMTDMRPPKIGVYELNGKYVVRDSTRIGEPILTHDGRIADNALPEDMRFFGMSLADAQALAEHLTR